MEYFIPAQNKLITHEITELRQELYNLKSCQITFLTFSVTATGILLGLGTSLGGEAILSLVSLFPLVFLLPAWWIFFDKATTITRIVGYYRILENLVLGQRKEIVFIGWENALRKFREKQDRRELVCPRNLKCKSLCFGTKQLFLLRTAHLYWLITYYIFFGLSGLCIVISLTKTLIGEVDWLWLSIGILAGIIFLLSAYWNGRLVWELIYGRHQYNCNEYFWEQVLKVAI